MSRGFYSRHYLADGRSFYYNAELNISTWNVPVDCSVLEAPRAKINVIGAADPADSDKNDEGPSNAVSQPSDDKAPVLSSVDDLLSTGWEEATKKKSPTE
jgi:hypothetical protein